MAWPDCVPGRISTAAGPSRVCTVSVVPSAAATIGIVTVQCRSSPWRSKIGCGRCTISRNRSPAGPPPGPVSPSPASWICVPSSTPAGIRTLMVRLVLTRPSASHSGHGLPMIVPNPPHCGQGREAITWPRNERVTWLTSPRPPHTSQVSGCVPGAVPSPEQVGQTTAVSTASSFVEPNAHSDRSSSTRIVAFRPPPGPAARPAGPRASAEEGIHDVAERETRRETAGASAPGRGERVGSHVIHLPLARVGEHLIGLGDLLEPLLGLRVWIDIRMQLPGQPPVGLLDLVRTRVVPDAEDGVVIVRHLHPYDSARIWPTYRATARTAPIAVG